MWGAWYQRGDPGPCPICGAPHTTCVGPTTLDDGSGHLTIPPRVVGPIPTPPPVDFNVRDYSQVKHGRKPGQP
jgi:hypothetical protein